ncbi:MAG: hypothetical protein F4Y88_03505 [Chloroflexi bacterium]|nr:hypothetical protein [Chloroflexota bacterium]
MGFIWVGMFAFGVAFVVMAILLIEAANYSESHRDALMLTAAFLNAIATVVVAAAVVFESEKIVKIIKEGRSSRSDED